MMSKDLKDLHSLCSPNQLLLKTDGWFLASIMNDPVEKLQGIIDKFIMPHAKEHKDYFSFPRNVPRVSDEVTYSS
jgi:hypothetical protein